MNSEPVEVANINKSLASQLPRNIISNAAYFIVSVIIGVILIPFFISTLGIAAYGLIPLATSITGYVVLVIQALNSSVMRHLTVDLQRGDIDAANRTFNTALFGLTGIIILMIPIIVVVSYSIPVVFNVPSGQETEVVLLFLGVSASFFVRAWSGNFTVQLFAYNRIDLQNYIDLTNLIVQVGLIGLFFRIFGPRLTLIGAAYLIGAIIATIIAILFSKQVSPHVKIAIKDFDRARLREIGSMGGWVSIDQIGTLIFLQIDLIVVNMLFGAASTGEYSIALQWFTLLWALSAVLAGVIQPMIYTYYAKGQIGTLVRVVKSSVKLMGLAMALPIGLICGFAPQLLTVWVGQDYKFLSPLIIMLTIPLAINLAVQPLFTINMAYKSIRIPSIVTLLTGILKLFLAVVLPLVFGLGYFGIAAAGAIVLTLRNVLFTPWYATRLLGARTNIFTRSMLQGVVAVFFVGISTAILTTLLPLSSLIPLILVGAAVAGMYILTIWVTALDKFERELFASYLPLQIRRILI